MLKKIFKIVAISLLCLIIIPWIFYFIFAYQGLLFSFWPRKALKGKIVYSTRTGPGIDINSVELASAKKIKIHALDYFGYVGSSAISSDGNKVILSKLSGQKGDSRFKLYTMNIDGSDMRELLDLDNYNAEHPSWSPDDQEIAFISQKPYRHGSLYVTDIDKPYSSLRNICNIRPASYKPTWSSDGEMISFISDDRLSKRLNVKWRIEVFVGKVFTINKDGRNLRQFKASKPVSWSPDGSKLLYRSKDGYYISDLSGAYTYAFIPYKRPAISLLVEDPALITWSPDGKYIAYVKEISPGWVGLGIYVVPIDNPKKEIQISAEVLGVEDMVWVK